MSKANDLMGEKLSDPLRRQFKELLSSIGFGDGTHAKRAGNHAGIILDYTSNAVANTADTLPHNLGQKPVHLFPTLPPNKQGASITFISATDKTITISCNVASTSFKLYLE